jgi:hypothetical protein
LPDDHQAFFGAFIFSVPFHHAEATVSERIMKWLDLQAVGARAFLCEQPVEDQEWKRIILVRNAERIESVLASLGFRRHVRNDLWIRPAVGMSLRALAAAIPGSAIREMEFGEVLRRLGAPLDPYEFPATSFGRERMGGGAVAPMDPPPPPPQAEGTTAAPDAPAVSKEEVVAVAPEASPDAVEPAPPPFDWEAARDLCDNLGPNHMNEMVRLHPEHGRFVLVDGAPVLEDPAKPSPRFLRIAKREDATVLLSSKVRRVISGQGSRLTWFEWSSFADATKPDGMPSAEWRRRLALRLVDVALSEIVSSGRGYRDAFDAAAAFMRGFPALSFILRDEPELAPNFRLPASLAFQRAVAQSAGGAGTVGILSAHPASFLGLFGAGTRVVPLGGQASGVLAETLSKAVLDAGRAGFHDRPLEENERFDAMLFEVVPARGEPVDLGGFVTGRTDLVALARSLEQRRPDGLTVALVDWADDVQAEVEAFCRWLGQRYALEGRADLLSEVWPAPEGRNTLAIAIGDRRPAPVLEPPPETWDITTIDDVEALWTWTTDLLATRSAIRQWHRAQDPALQGPEDDEGALQVRYRPGSRSGQASSSVSRALSASISVALDRLSARCAEVHGVPDIDALVARELGVARERLPEILSPEQVDAVAMAIDAETRGRGFLLGDQMGLGKGRTLAAMMARALRQGRKVLFLTERAINIPDIVRDFRDIGMWDLCRPLILNRGVVVRDEDGNVIAAAPRDDERTELLSGMAWPDGYNLVIGTYSQFSSQVARQQPRRRGAEQEPPRNVQEAEPEEISGVRLSSRWVREALDEDCLVVLDESHNVAQATSNAADNISRGMARVPFVMFSSGTWAKNARNLEIYRPILPPGVSHEEMSRLIARGGLVMQETFANMLARDGMFIARQHDLSSCRFEVAGVSAEENARIMRATDHLADVLAEIGRLSNEVDGRVGRYNAALTEVLRQRFGDDERRFDREMRRLELRRMSMGAPLYEISRAFLASALADTAARLGVEALDRGEKPVFLFDRTMGAILNEAKKLVDAGEIQGAPDFREFLRKTAARMLKIEGQGLRELRHLLEEPGWPKAAEGMLDVLREAHPTTFPVEDVANALERAMAKVAVGWNGAAEELATAAEFLEERLGVALDATGGRVVPGFWDGVDAALPMTTERAIRRVMRLIDRVPSLPLSAIDRIKDLLEEEGRRRAADGRVDRPWVVGEITGRGLELRNGEFRPMPKLDRRALKDGFQDGGIDALIINTAGATGIDLHAAEKYADRRPRVMIEVQAPADITRQIQAYGRVNRLGQLHPPRIVTVTTGLPIEARLLAMRNAKLRRLSANVTGSRENAGVLEDTPDLMNAVGDQVCQRYFQLRPQLLERLGLDPERMADVGVGNAEDAVGADDDADASRSASWYLARLALLPVAWQERTLREIEHEYRAMIEELDARGENPLREDSIKGTVRTLSRTLFDGVPDEEGSAFRSPVHLEKISIVHRDRPMSWLAIMSRIEDAVAEEELSGSNTKRIAAKLRESKENYLSSLLPTGVASVEQALAQQSPVIVNMNRRIDRLVDFLDAVVPGSSINLQQDGEDTAALVLGVSAPDAAKLTGSLFHPASYRVMVALPGLSKPMEFSLSALLSFERMELGPGVHGEEIESLRMAFVLREGREVAEERHVLTGNLMTAMSMNMAQKLGRLVTWRREDGAWERGVLISKRHHDLRFMPVRVTNPEIVHRALMFDNDVRAYSTPELSPHGVRLKYARHKNAYSITVPKPTCRRFGHLHQNEAFHMWLDAVSRGAYGFEVEEKSAFLQAGVRGNENGVSGVNRLLSILSDAGHAFYFASRYREHINWLGADMARRAAAERAEAREARDFIENGPPVPDAAERRVA